MSNTATVSSTTDDPVAGNDSSTVSTTVNPQTPSTKNDCKDGGWHAYGIFKNGGDCVSYVATHNAA